jgi:hypothetical protein
LKQGKWLEAFTVFVVGMAGVSNEMRTAVHADMRLQAKKISGKILA